MKNLVVSLIFALSLVIPVVAQSDQLNVIITPGREVELVAVLVVEGLVKIDEGLRPIPCIAKSWESDGEWIEWLFHLRQDVYFHDGNPLTAHDVVYSLSGKFAVVEAVDDYTVRVRLESPNSNFLYALYAIPVVPRDFFFRFEGEILPDEEIAKALVGTGPYLLCEWAPYDHLTFERFEDYWGSGPSFERLHCPVIQELSTQLMMLESGQADLILNATRDQWTEAGYLGLETYTAPSDSYLALGFNFNTELFSDPRVRRAIAHAIDRDSIVECIYQGEATVCEGPIRPEYLGGDTLEPGYEYDLEYAQKLLEEAGYDGGLSFSIMIHPYNDDLIGSAQVIQENLAQLGARVELETVPYPVYYEKLNSGDFEAVIFLQSTGFPVPNLRSWVSDSSRNFLGYSNPEIDNLIDQVPYVLNQDQRVDLYRSIDDRIAQDLPCVWLLYPHQYAVARSELRLGGTPWQITVEDGTDGIVLLANEGYWWCVGKILKCQFFSAACILGAPACAATCAKACALTAGIVCIDCYVRCAAGTVAVCITAYNCWIAAKDAGCLP